MVDCGCRCGGPFRLKFEFESNGVAIISVRYLRFLSKTTRIARLSMALYGTKIGPANIVSSPILLIIPFSTRIHTFYSHGPGIA